MGRASRWGIRSVPPAHASSPPRRTKPSAARRVSYSRPCASAAAKDLRPCSKQSDDREIPGGAMSRTVICSDAAEAVAGIEDGSTILVGGFGMAGMPTTLIDALIEHGASDLTIVSNNAGNGDTGLAALLAAGRVAKVICSFPRQADSYVFDGLYRAQKIDLEVVPQGNLAERIRAAGAGIGAFFCPTGVGTPLADGKETRTIDGRAYVLEYPIGGDVALIGAHIADRAGNLLYRKTARNFGPVMATAAALTIAEVARVVDAGDIDPEIVVTPGIFVDRVLNLSELSDTQQKAS